MTQWIDWTLKQAHDAFAAGKVSARELTMAYLEAIEKRADLNAYITVTADHALKAADDCDSRRNKGEILPLAGVPLAIKDLFCTQGVRTTCASHILENFVSPYESTVSDRLRKAGAIMLGKTNMDEFAMGSANLHSHFGPAINPWRRRQDDKKLVPGGSSGGSAAAVAGRIALAAIGTDTGGSIRQPAAFCGVVGLKPTYGRCSRYGMMAFASSLDQAGPITRTVEDAAWMLNVMAGYDERDSTCAKREVEDFTRELGQGAESLTIGIPKQYRIEEMSSSMDDLWQKGAQWLRDAGAKIVEIDLPHTSYALPAYYIIAPAEASSNLARYDGVRYGLRVGKEEADGIEALYAATRGEGFGDEVKRRIMIGTYVLSRGYYDAYYLRAARVRALIQRDFQRAFEKVDAILTPTTPGPAFAMDEKQSDPIAMYLNDVFTVPASLAGNPAMNVPVALDDQGLPLGLQLIASPFEEAKMLRLAAVLESSAAFSPTPP